MMSAHAALVKITGQGFGYKNYDDWVAGGGTRTKSSSLKQGCQRPG